MTKKEQFSSRRSQIIDGFLNYLYLLGLKNIFPAIKTKKTAWGYFCLVPFPVVYRSLICAGNKSKDLNVSDLSFIRWANFG